VDSFPCPLICIWISPMLLCMVFVGEWGDSMHQVVADWCSIYLYPSDKNLVDFFSPPPSRVRPCLSVRPPQPSNASSPVVISSCQKSPHIQKPLLEFSLHICHMKEVLTTHLPFCPTWHTKSPFHAGTMM
jgi:hypothetical protein